MEGDFPRLHLHDTLFNLKDDVIVYLAATLRMFTKCIVIQKRVEDLQLGVKSYQKKLNIFRPMTHKAGITNLKPYSAYSNLQGLHQSDTKVFTMMMEILLELTSNKLCGRTASEAAKPYQGDSLKFYLITGIIYTDYWGFVVILMVDAAGSRQVEFKKISLKGFRTCTSHSLHQSISKQTTRYVVPTGRVVVPTGRYVVSASKVIIIVSPGRLSLVPTGRVLSPGSDNESDDVSDHSEATIAQQQQNIQPQIITTVSNNNVKFPYLKKDKDEVWAIKIEYWITNNDIDIWKVIQNSNSLKRTGRDHDRRVIILPPTTADEHIAVQRESKAKTTLLQFGGNAESKKMRKSMLKQEFSEIQIDEAEDAQRVALTLKTKDGLELLSFDDLYYKLKTLEVDIKGYSTFSSSQSAGPSHSAFVSTTSASKKMSYADSPSYSSSTYTAPSNSKTGSHRSEMLEGTNDFEKKESARFNQEEVRMFTSVFKEATWLENVGQKEEMTSRDIPHSRFKRLERRKKNPKP
ncbi:hypothetical protein Tco_0359465 [Tanacetum coccineum]